MGEDRTFDDFLGGALRLCQPSRGYRAGTDPVYLAAAVPARPGETVLELGCGTGAAAFCLARRVVGVAVTGLELNPAYAALARENAAANRLALEVIEGDVGDLPAALRTRSFDHVIANPPYHRRETGTRAGDAGREAAFGEARPLRDWIDAGLRRLKPGGRITMIQTVERLPEMLAALAARAGDVTVHPLASRAGRPARRVIVSARKGAHGPFVLAAPTILHDGPAHDGDRDSYAAEAQAVLRQGAAWSWTRR